MLGLYSNINRRLLVAVIVVTIVTIAPFPAFSQPERKVYTPVSRPHPWEEVLMDFSVVYVVLWASYFAFQPHHVKALSLDNFRKNVFEIGAVLYDYNAITTNFVGHPLAGSEYYLYFRSRGYAPKWAIVNMIISSTMFEIAVESFHKPFSTIDFVVTPLLGAPLGVWRERQGLRMVNSDRKYHRFIGHILYFETNVWFFEDAHISPVIDLETGFSGFSLYAVF